MISNTVSHTVDLDITDAADWSDIEWIYESMIQNNISAEVDITIIDIESDALTLEISGHYTEVSIFTREFDEI